MALKYCRTCKTKKDETAFKRRGTRYVGRVCGKCRYQADKSNRTKPNVRARRQSQDRDRRKRPEVKLKQQAWSQAYRARPDVKARLKAKYAEYYRRPDVAARRKKRMAAYYARPDVKARINAKNKMPRPPKKILTSRVRAAIYTSLRGAKAGRKWQSLVGYGIDDLRLHLERQFLNGMSWENIGEWHVDHIVPVSSFSYQSSEDPDFLACWALTNLRPLWAPDNRRKSARREFLL